MQHLQSIGVQRSASGSTLPRYYQTSSLGLPMTDRGRPVIDWPRLMTALRGVDPELVANPVRRQREYEAFLEQSIGPVNNLVVVARRLAHLNACFSATQQALIRVLIDSQLEALRAEYDAKLDALAARFLNATVPSPPPPALVEPVASILESPPKPGPASPMAAAYDGLPPPEAFPDISDLDFERLPQDDDDQWWRRVTQGMMKS